MKQSILEACVDSVESAVIAAGAGADRLELCANLLIGGTTPTLAAYRQVRKRCDSVIHVLIRPRFGDFCYTDNEFEIMKQEICQFREAGADGVVIGILNPDGSLCYERMAAFVEVAGPLSVTLHRAFDVCRNPEGVLEQAVTLGVRTILTSGQANVCTEGISCLKKLKEQSRGRIDIMAGSGVNAGVIADLYHTTGITSYHMSGKVTLESPMQYRKADVHMGLDTVSEYERWQTGEEAIKKAAAVLHAV